MARKLIAPLIGPILHVFVNVNLPT
jgi:hypothetical protein